MIASRSFTLFLIWTLLSIINSDGCSDNEYQCGNGMCIAQGFVCDGADDCRDRSDERNCTPTSHDFEHVFGYEDYNDLFDFINQSSDGCSDNEYQCGNGMCIPQGFVCDGADDCRDRSDERNCTFSNPHLRVARWMDSDDNVMVGCVHEWHQSGHFFLTITEGTNITTYDPDMITVKASFFNINVTPPASITCAFNILGQTLTSEEYTLGAHYGSEPQTPPVPLSYQMFAGFTSLVLITMTMVVIVFTFRGKQGAGPDKTTECNIYEETITV
ncbi:hypothetical protein AALO_G00055100 [Alosa alosa]|uniref:Uncharacterized protein n=2 Tax=Alosa alosa TaxID=278164 RepID=A0AAV6HAA4_9TELE|nr:hypothetical protein AALO_G00055100 [Alosa alosa]